MIAFLVVTSILNIALGYWLAVFLRNASARGAPEDTPLADAMGAFAASIPAAAMERMGGAWPVDGVAATAAALPPRPAAAQESSSHAMLSAEGAAEEREFQMKPTEMDQELLAGIEEFRNQLAQLRGQGFDVHDQFPLEVGSI